MQLFIWFNQHWLVGMYTAWGKAR